MGEEHLFSLVEMEAGLLGKNADMEVGFLGMNSDRYMNDYPYPVTSPPPPPRSGFFEDPFYEQSRYFLHACFLCNKPLGQNRDIFMYRGDTPFCREECRQEQIGIDEAIERNQILSLKSPSFQSLLLPSKTDSATSSEGWGPSFPSRKKGIEMEIQRDTHQLLHTQKW